MTAIVTRTYRHTLATRLLHMALASAIVLQLLTSLWMQAPRKDRQEDWLFVIHQYSGLAALLLALGFWMLLMFRRRGTEVALLFPWLNPDRRRALGQDLQLHLRSLKSRRLPDYQAEDPLASAVHGLGLFLMTAMAGSGAIYFLALSTASANSAWATIDIDIHHALANLAWIYLVAHAGLAVIHHYLKHMDLREMWSWRK